MSYGPEAWAQLRQRRYADRPDVTGTQGDHPAQYTHPGQGIDAPYVTTNQTTSSASFVDMTGMYFSVKADVDYGFRFHGTYTSSNTGTGIAIGFKLEDGATGNERGMTEIYGETTPTSLRRDWQTSDDDGGTGTTGVDIADTARAWVLEGRFQCTADGTFMVRFKRQGANHNITIQAGSCGIVSGF